ncbi:MAG TPA: hypothetical protein VM095_15735 [Pyrinomonadaceae bacterium]|nr:hypothetical protein [Pyrinomonadaceae bacterium]
MCEQIVTRRSVTAHNLQNIEGGVVERYEPSALVLAVRYENSAGRDNKLLPYEMLAVSFSETVVL